MFLYMQLNVKKTKKDEPAYKLIFRKNLNFSLQKTTSIRNYSAFWQINPESNFCTVSHIIKIAKSSQENLHPNLR